MAAQEFIIDPVMTLDWMSNVILLSSCVQLIMYLQSVSVQLVKHDLVWPQAGSGGIPAAVRLVWNTKNETSNNDIFKWRFAIIYIKLYITDQNHGLVQFYFFLEHHIIENKASFKTVIWCLWEFVVSGFYSSISSSIVCVWLLFLSLDPLLAPQFLLLTWMNCVRLISKVGATFESDQRKQRSLPLSRPHVYKNS